MPSPTTFLVSRYSEVCVGCPRVVDEIEAVVERRAELDGAATCPASLTAQSPWPALMGESQSIRPLRRSTIVNERPRPEGVGDEPALVRGVDDLDGDLVAIVGQILVADDGPGDGRRPVVVAQFPPICVLGVVHLVLATGEHHADGDEHRCAEDQYDGPDTERQARGKRPGAGA